MPEQDNAKEQMESIQEMATKLFGGKDTETETQNIIDKHTKSLVEEFNGMLTQITFDILLQMLGDEQAQQLRSQVYGAWHARIEEQLAEVDKPEGVGSMLLDVEAIVSKAVEKADVVIKDFLKPDVTK